MESRIEHSPWHSYYRIGRKMINEKNICKLIPKCSDNYNDNENDDDDGKSLKKIKSNLLENFDKAKKLDNLLEKLDKAKKLDNLLSRKESNQPDFRKPFRIMRKAKKLRFVKRLFNRKIDRLGRKMSRILF